MWGKKTKSIFFPALTLNLFSWNSSESTVPVAMPTRLTEYSALPRQLDTLCRHSWYILHCSREVIRRPRRVMRRVLRSAWDCSRSLVVWRTVSLVVRVRPACLIRLMSDPLVSMESSMVWKIQDLKARWRPCCYSIQNVISSQKTNILNFLFLHWVKLFIHQIFTMNYFLSLKFV